jgi:hypothetical protein
VSLWSFITAARSRILLQYLLRTSSSISEELAAAFDDDSRHAVHVCNHDHPILGLVQRFRQTDCVFLDAMSTIEKSRIVQPPPIAPVIHSVHQ